MAGDGGVLLLVCLVRTVGIIGEEQLDGRAAGECVQLVGLPWETENSCIPPFSIRTYNQPDSTLPVVLVIQLHSTPR